MKPDLEKDFKLELVTNENGLHFTRTSLAKSLYMTPDEIPVWLGTELIPIEMLVTAYASLSDQSDIAVLQLLVLAEYGLDRIA